MSVAQACLRFRFYDQRKFLTSTFTAGAQLKFIESKNSHLEYNFEDDGYFFLPR